MAFPAPPESALTTPRFAFRHSMIPRPESSKKESSPDDLSPKSVIVDRRFISPASSSSSSIDRRITLSEANHLKCQPRHDRGYSISDGEFSDPDSFLDSSSTSRELGKVGNSEPLESLPETHSLALEATHANTPMAEEMSNAPTTSNQENSLDQSSEPIAVSILSERSNDSKRGDRGLQPPAVDQDDHYRINPLDEWSQTSSSSESFSEQDVKEPSSRSYTRHRHTESESGPRGRDYTCRPAFSAELSTSGNPLEGVDDRKRIAVGQGAASYFGYPGTPLRLFPVLSQGHCGALINNAPALDSASPRIEKATGGFSPASPADLSTGLRFLHRFHSGPITGSLIPKPPPSKWDDAEKWIVSPGHNDQSPAQLHHRPLQTIQGRRHPIAGAQSFRSSYGAGSPDYCTPGGEKPMSPQVDNAFMNPDKHGGGPALADSMKKRSKALSFGDLSRRFDPQHAVGKPPSDTAFKDGECQRPQVSLDAQTNLAIEARLTKQISSNAYQQAQSPDGKSEIAGSNVNTSYDGSKDSRLSKHARSVSMNETGRVPLAVEQAVSYQEPATSVRDIGTQMTPAESLRNSTCTTPGVTMTSPTRHNVTPARSGRRASSLGAIPGAVDSLELQSCHLAKLELRKLAGDAPTVDRYVVWNTREEEERESAASLRADREDLGRCQLAAKAANWEEAEQTKALLRYKNKEEEIKGWEERQNSQAEAEMKKTEVKAEKILAEANAKMKNKLALTAKKAAEKRATAEKLRNEQAAKTAGKAELMRKTGRLSPPPRSSLTCCFRV